MLYRFDKGFAGALHERPVCKAVTWRGGRGRPTAVAIAATAAVVIIIVVITTAACLTGHGDCICLCCSVFCGYNYIYYVRADIKVTHKSTIGVNIRRAVGCCGINYYIRHAVCNGGGIACHACAKNRRERSRADSED
jgi:hypothetical protein